MNNQPHQINYKCSKCLKRGHLTRDCPNPTIYHIPHYERKQLNNESQLKENLLYHSNFSKPRSHFPEQKSQIDQNNFSISQFYAEMGENGKNLVSTKFDPSAITIYKQKDNVSVQSSVNNSSRQLTQQQIQQIPFKQRHLQNEPSIVSSDQVQKKLFFETPAQFKKGNSRSRSRSNSNEKSRFNGKRSQARTHKKSENSILDISIRNSQRNNLSQVQCQQDLSVIN